MIQLMPQDSHWYWSVKKKCWYPSVTTVTSYLPKGKFFEKYLAEQDSYEDAKRILKEAGDRGTHCHQASEVLDKGGELKYGLCGLTDNEYKLMIGYVNWHKKYQPEILQDKIELPLISDKMKLGGTADRIYNIDGKLTLFDLKTSKSAIYDSHWIQVACYSEMYEELYKTQIDQVAILRLTPKRKEGYEYVVRSREQWKKDYKQFKNTYETMVYLNGGKDFKPSIIEVPEILTLDTIVKSSDVV